MGGDNIYCLGGVAGNVMDPSRSVVFDQIFQYDPRNPDKSPTIMAARLPTARALLSCAPAAGKIYCLGGVKREPNGLPAALGEVIEYDFEKDLVTLKKAEFPEPSLGLSCAPSGDRVFCFGGAASVFAQPTAGIFEYDPVADVLAVKGIGLPTGRLALSCASTSRSILCFGGFPEALLYTGSPALANSLSQVFEYCPRGCGE